MNRGGHAAYPKVATGCDAEPVRLWAPDALLEQAAGSAPVGAVNRAHSLMRARRGPPSRGTALSQIAFNLSGFDDLADKWRGVSIAPRLE